MAMTHLWVNGALAMLPVLVMGACGSEAQSDVSPGSNGCAAEGLDTSTRPVTDVVVVQGNDPPCGVTFELVLELDGSLEGTLPRYPVAVGPGGRWLTGTYAEGEFAVWSPEGDLERRIGIGSGDGPGEFGRVSDLVVDSVAGTVHVFSNSSRVEVFSLEGEHLTAIRLPDRAVGGVRLADGTIASAPSTSPDSPRLLLLTGDSVFRAGPARRFVFPPEVRAGASDVWTVEAPWYQFDRHVLPSGAVDLSVRREVEWFPAVSEQTASSAGGPLVQGFAVDPERGLVFARLLIIEPAPPPRGLGEQVPQPLDPSDPPDGVVEVFTLGGDLVASSRFENGREIPWPLSTGPPGAFWYRVNDDATRSIDIFRPVLVPRVDE